MSIFQPKNLPAYDLSITKRIEGVMSPDLHLRIGLTSAVLLMLWWLCDIWQTWVMLLSYVAAMILHGMYVQWLPQHVAFTQARIVQLSLVGIGLIWAFSLGFLWNFDDMAIRLVPLFGLFVTMINAFAARREDRLLMAADLINIFTSISALTLVSFWFRNDLQEALMIFVSATTVFVFCSYGLYDLHKLRRDLERAGAQKAEQSRMEIIGRLTGGVAHDFNNLMTVIRGNLDLIHETDDAAEKDEYARQALHATEQAANVTAQLLTYVGRGALRPIEVEIWDVFERVAERLEKHLPSQLSFALTVEAGLPPLVLDPKHLEDVLTNLCRNARNAVAEDGQISLTARWLGANEQRDYDFGQKPAVCIEVIDNGAGIAPNVLDRVCDPYFTTRPQGGGLGLANAKGFAIQSGGDLTIRSKLGAGTTVSLVFPVPDQVD